TDKADVESEAVRNSLDWDLLEHLATDEDELKASILNEWRYRDFYIRYQEYLLISRCKILVGNTQTLELHPVDAGCFKQTKRKTVLLLAEFSIQPLCQS
ncbi:MAG: DUF6036 family nucleotidyltransferase, partial [Faecalibacterium prausnitzii]|nr:DUF6036 family nucleotidyltransferase [Faecalibacterium prausnitzii]